MFAIVKLGNQQFKVKAGDFIRTPFQNYSKGDTVDLSVLAFGDEKDLICEEKELKKSKVKAVLIRQSLANKIIVFKKKRRKGYRRTQGHRQKVSEFRILELYSPTGQVSKVESTKKITKADPKKGTEKTKVTKKSVTNKKQTDSVKTKVKKAEKSPVKTKKAEKPVVKVKVQKTQTSKKSVKTEKQTKKGD